MSKLDSSNKSQTRTANGNGYSRIEDGDPDGDRRNGLMTLRLFAVKQRSATKWRCFALVTAPKEPCT
jgi:hypothetical protein